MTFGPRFVAPAGTALRVSEVAVALRDTFRRVDGRSELAATLAASFGLPHVALLSTGRAAMSLTLRLLAARDPARREVVVPGYTCYSVAASAVREGLTVRPLDVDPSTLDFTPDALASIDPGRTLAVITTGLYGIPTNLPLLESLARDLGVALIDDAAQCLGARVDSRWAGTFGTAGILSFDKGKNITSLQGGAIVTADSQLGEAVTATMGGLREPSFSRAASLSVQLAAYAALLRPSLYWLPNALLRLGETPFEVDFPIDRYPGGLATAIARQWVRLDAITASRARNAAALRERLNVVPGVTFPNSPGAQAVFPRFPLFLDSPARRERALRALVEAGIGATRSYPRALVDVPPLQPHLAPDVHDTPRARDVAERILTLPTHSFLQATDIARIAQVLSAT